MFHTPSLYLGVCLHLPYICFTKIGSNCLYQKASGDLRCVAGGVCNFEVQYQDTSHGERGSGELTIVDLYPEQGRCGRGPRVQVCMHLGYAHLNMWALSYKNNTHSTPTSGWVAEQVASDTRDGVWNLLFPSSMYG